MKTLQLGTSDLQVSRIGYGCMHLGGSWDSSPITEQTHADALKSIHAALDAGINLFDHADIYCMGKSEKVFAGIWKGKPHLREEIYLQTKCGIIFPGHPNPSSPQRFDFSYEHIINSVEGSLKRLQTEYIDVLLLHRPDPLVEPEEVARAFDVLYQSGKVHWFGVSNHTAAQIRLLKSFLNQPIVTNQVEFHLLNTQILDEGVNFNQKTTRLTRNEGTIEYCRQHNITLQSWASMAWGLLSGRELIQPDEKIEYANEVVAKMAREKDVSREAIVIAWILRHPARIQALVGTTKPQRIANCTEADQFILSHEDWYTLYLAGRGSRLP